jgi:hypothetical protein
MKLLVLAAVAALALSSISAGAANEPATTPRTLFCKVDAAQVNGEPSRLPDAGLYVKVTDLGHLISLNAGGSQWPTLVVTWRGDHPWHLEAGGRRGGDGTDALGAASVQLTIGTMPDYRGLTMLYTMKGKDITITDRGRCTPN